MSDIFDRADDARKEARETGEGPLAPKEKDDDEQV
jgi:hypothetical protein